MWSRLERNRELDLGLVIFEEFITCLTDCQDISLELGGCSEWRLAFGNCLSLQSEFIWKVIVAWRDLRWAERQGSRRMSCVATKEPWN